MADHVLARGPDCLEADGFGLVDYGEQAAAALRVMAVSAWGWRFDGDTWRPTKEHVTRRAWAKKVLEDPDRWTAAEVQEARCRLNRGQFYHDGEREKLFTEDPLTPDVARRFVLPTRIECIECGAINRVDQAVNEALEGLAEQRLTARRAVP